MASLNNFLPLCLHSDPFEGPGSRIAASTRRSSPDQHVVGAAGRADLHHLETDLPRREFRAQRSARKLLPRAGRQHDDFGREREQRREMFRASALRRMRGVHGVERVRGHDAARADLVVADGDEVGAVAPDEIDARRVVAE